MVGIGFCVHSTRTGKILSASKIKIYYHKMYVFYQIPAVNKKPIKTNNFLAKRVV